jgi:GntR family transcriptional regulator, transcriptional repressor for pyruvate dehydrogenase complex
VPSAVTLTEVDKAQDAGQRDTWLDTERAEKIPEVVARQILRDIVKDGLQPGDMLPPEAVMLTNFGVARASLREALLILEVHGVIRIKAGPRGGPVVAQPMPADFGRASSLYFYRVSATFEDLVESRQVLEPVMARLAAQRLTEDLADRIRAAQAAGWGALEEPPDVWSSASEEFHRALAGATGNRVLDLYASSLLAIERHRLTPLFSDVEDRRQTLRIHDRIAEAVLAKDGDRAEELSRRHLEELSKIRQLNYARKMTEFIEWQ